MSEKTGKNHTLKMQKNSIKTPSFKPLVIQELSKNNNLRKMHTFRSFFTMEKMAHALSGVLIGQKHIDILLLHLLRDATENIHLFQNGLLGNHFYGNLRVIHRMPPDPPKEIRP